MFCKHCGADIGEQDCCPVCKDKQTNVNQNTESSTSSTISKKSKSDFSIAFEKMTYTFGIIDKLSKVLLLVTAMLSIVVAFTFFYTNGYSQYYSSSIARLIYTAKFVVPVGLLVSLLGSLPYFFFLLSLRAMTKKHQPSDRELFEQAEIYGKIKIGIRQKNLYAWQCIAFAKSEKANSFIFANQISNMASLLLSSVVSYFYFSGLWARFVIVGGLPSENLLGFFITPLGVVLIVFLTFPTVLSSILNTNKIFKQLKEEYLRKNEH